MPEFIPLDQLLTRKQVARLLKVNPVTVGRWTIKGLLPCLQWNRHLVRYDPTVVRDFLQRRGVLGVNLLSRKQVARLLNVKRSTVYLWTKSGELPCVEIKHNLLRYEADTVRAFMLSKQRKPKVREGIKNAIGAAFRSVPGFNDDPAIIPPKRFNTRNAGDSYNGIGGP